MNLIILIIAAFSLIPLIDLKELREINKKPLALTVYFSILAGGLIIGILLVLDKAPLSPAVLIEKLINILPGRSK